MSQNLDDAASDDTYQTRQAENIAKKDHPHVLDYNNVIENVSSEMSIPQCDIITLFSDKRRMHHVQSFKEKHQHINIFKAVDKQDNEKMVHLREYYNMKIKEGAAGCALSHILLIEKFISSNSKYQIVLEDDFKIVKELPKTNKEIDEMIAQVNQTPEMVDILYLSERVNANNKYQVINGCGTEGYILTKHGAKKILAVLTNKCDYPIDIKIQGHFHLANENKWCQCGTIHKNIVINAYKSKEPYVLLNNFLSNVN